MNEKIKKILTGVSWTFFGVGTTGLLINGVVPEQINSVLEYCFLGSNVISGIIDIIIANIKKKE